MIVFNFVAGAWWLSMGDPLHGLGLASALGELLYRKILYIEFQSVCGIFVFYQLGCRQAR
jgi:hypothetical protein